MPDTTISAKVIPLSVPVEADAHIGPSEYRKTRSSRSDVAIPTSNYREQSTSPPL